MIPTSVEFSQEGGLILMGAVLLIVAIPVMVVFYSAAVVILIGEIREKRKPIMQGLSTIHNKGEG